MQRGVQVFQLQEQKSWQVVLESIFFFFIAIYFLAEILEPDKGDKFDDCKQFGTSDGFWVYFSLIFSAVSMAVVFRKEDLYLLPAAFYTTNSAIIRDFAGVDIFQDDADEALYVAKDPEDKQNNPLRKDDIITQIDKADFTEEGLTSEAKIDLWAQERHRIQTSLEVSVTFKRKWENSDEARNWMKTLLFLWRCCQIGCRMTLLTVFLQIWEVVAIVSYMFCLTILSIVLHLIQKFRNVSGSGRVSYMDVFLYSVMNIILLDLRYLANFELPSIINVLYICDFFTIYIVYIFIDDNQGDYIAAIAILLFISIVGLVLIFWYMDVDNYVCIRNRNVQKLLKNDQFARLEALIVYRVISIDELGKDYAPKLILLLSQNEAVDKDQIILSLYDKRSEYEERLKVMFLKECCVRLKVGLDLETGPQCPSITVEHMKEKLMKSFGREVEDKIVRKFFDRVNQVEQKAVQNSKPRQNYITLAPIWQTDEPEELPNQSPALVAEPSLPADPEDPGIVPGEVKLDALCSYIFETPLDRFMKAIYVILFDKEVEKNRSVDRQMGLFLAEHLESLKNKEFKNTQRQTPQKPEAQPPLVDTSELVKQIDNHLFLKRTPWFSNFPNIQLDTICDRLKVTKLDGEITDVAPLYVIKSGRVKMEFEDDFMFLESGDTFGHSMKEWENMPKFYVEGDSAELMVIDCETYDSAVESLVKVAGNFVIS
jgi:hypothetical protein